MYRPYPRSADTEVSLIAVTDRRILWVLTAVPILLVVWRTTTQVGSRAREIATHLPATEKLEDPALLDLAISVGVMLACITFGVGLILYFRLSAFVDDRFFRDTLIGTSASVDCGGRRRGIGPALAVSVASVVPLQLTSLVFSITSIRDTWYSYGWVAISLCVIVIIWVPRWKLHAFSRKRVAGSVITVALVALCSQIF